MTIDEYLGGIPEDQVKYIQKLREYIKKSLPKGFVEVINYEMIGYVVPHSLYPSGYHCNPEDPLPFMNIASKKNSINFYHMGIYGNKDLYKWFMEEYSKQSKHKIDCGGSCIRFKYFDEIPYDLISELVSKISVNDWIENYEKNIKPKDKKNKSR